MHDGTRDGLKVDGLAVGLHDGTRDGLKVDGLAVGLNDGTRDGTEVRVGLTEGESVGLQDSLLVPEGIDVTIGNAVGSCDGDAVTGDPAIEYTIPSPIWMFTVDEKAE